MATRAPVLANPPPVAVSELASGLIGRVSHTDGSVDSSSSAVGAVDGSSKGSADGSAEGSSDGLSVGSWLGASVGPGVDSQLGKVLVPGPPQFLRLR